MYNQVIVVEGKHDEQKIKSIYPEVDCIVTNGSEISDATLNLIVETSKKRDVILFLDPDFPGKKITKKILDTNGDFKIAFIDKNKAKSKNDKKVGIEHADTDDIKRSLENFFEIQRDGQDEIKIQDLYIRRLINHKSSRKLRKNVCKSLNIPVFNGKAFLKYLNILGIDIKKIDEVLNG